MKLKLLAGSGDRIGLVASPFLIIGLILNIVDPSSFSVGGPSGILRLVSVIALVAGVTVWLWSVVLILTKGPKKQLMSRAS